MRFVIRAFDENGTPIWLGPGGIIRYHPREAKAFFDAGTAINQALHAFTARRYIWRVVVRPHRRYVDAATCHIPQTPAA